MGNTGNSARQITHIHFYFDNYVSGNDDGHDDVGHDGDEYNNALKRAI